MTERSRSFFLICSLLLCFVLSLVLLTVGSLASILHALFVPYQYFLIGICVGALTMATLGLIIDRGQWAHYRLYFFAVLLSAFMLVVVNSVIYKVLYGEQFIHKLVALLLAVFRFQLQGAGGSWF